MEEAIRNREWEVLRDLHEVAANSLRHYYVVGGMPEAVAAYCRTRNFIDVRAVHGEILEGCRRDISKHAPKSDVRKVEMCWMSIPAQLAKENKKFSYIRRYRPDAAYRASMLPYVVQNVAAEDGSLCRLTNIPLYAICYGIVQYAPHQGEWVKLRGKS